MAEGEDVVEKGMRAKMLVVVASCVLVGACLAVGCRTADGGAETTSRDDAVVQAESFEAWTSRYPAQYYSFVDGADRLAHDEDGDEASTNGYPKSHAASYKTIASVYGRDGSAEDTETRAACIACKSTVYNEWFESEGLNLLYDLYDEEGNYLMQPEYFASLEETDIWNCGLCHADIDDPSGSLRASQVTFTKLFGSTLYSRLDARTAVCAQCHNSLAPWIQNRYLHGVDLEETSVDPYKYGLDPASLLRAIREYATETSVVPGGMREVEDAEGAAAGMYRFYYTGYPNDVEAFQDSVMQALGVTCVDCHMSASVATDGTTFTSHDASGSVVDSSAAMTYCLSCHDKQGVESAEGMADFVQAAQGRLGAQVEALDDALGRLRGAIILGHGAGLGEGALDDARLAWATASFYRDYVVGGAQTYGKKIAHNPTMLPMYVSQAQAMVDEALAALA